MKKISAGLSGVLAIVALSAAPAEGNIRPHENSHLPAVDRALEEAAARSPRAPLPHQIAARARLAAAVPSLSVTWHRDSGTPALVRADSGLPVAVRGTGSAKVRDFFNRNCDLFDACTGVTLSTEGVERFEPRGTSRVLLRQIADGREVYRAAVGATIDSQGRLLNVTSHVIRGLKPGPAPRLAEKEMIQRALGFAGAAGHDDLKLTTREIAYPWRGVAWPALLVWVRGSGDLNYKIAVDAVRGDLLMRSHMVMYGVPTARGKVFLRPPNDLQDPNDPSPVQPTEMSFAGDPVASPDNWVSDVAVGPEIPSGNNVAEAAYFPYDLSPPRIPTDEGGEFLYSWDRAYTDCAAGGGYVARVTECHEATDDPLLAATNLFFHANRMHDLLFDLGFTEAWGNFQQVNFQNPEGAGDAISMQSVSVGIFLKCNARYLHSPDGEPPRIEMGLFHTDCGSTEIVDSSLDVDVIYHEYGHGLSTRIIGADNMNLAMGEGWSDFLAAHFLSGPGAPGSEADPAGPYHYADYVFAGGVRQYPMATSMTLNPLTFADLCGGPCTQWDNGEIWANVLWETRFNIVEDHGFNPGHEIMGRLLVESMKILSSGPPDMILGRDALLAADGDLYAGANCTSIWNAFAKRGLGQDAAFGDAAKTIPIADSAPLPDSDEDGVVDRCEPAGGGGGGGCGQDGCHDFGLE